MAEKTGPTIIAVDVETTGLDPKLYELVEVGAVRHEVGGKALDTFQELIRPRRPLPAKTKELTGITQELVDVCRSEAEVIADFIAWTGDDRVLVAHNAPFDCEFIAEAAKRHGISYPTSWEAVDTLAWSRTRIKGARNHQLATLLRVIRFRPPGELHRALADAHGVAALVDHIWKGYKDPKSALQRQTTPFAEMAIPEPATSRQLSYLRSLGASPHELDGITKRRASALIDRYTGKSGRADRPRTLRGKAPRKMKTAAPSPAPSPGPVKLFGSAGALGCAVLFILFGLMYSCVSVLG